LGFVQCAECSEYVAVGEGCCLKSRKNKVSVFETADFYG
jgi:hypothetical protein